MPTTPNNWIRWTAFAALLLGAVGLYWSWELTQEVYRTAALHRDALHSYAVQDSWYVTPALGLKRNIVLLVSVLAVLVSWTVAFRRELRFMFWDRYLQK